ncbi:DNA-binding domain-containing protein [Listeria weihenstephanensis FSL R9-0317]|uniref:DNA-binding protein n=1 Tax=Listeria weihenstephanensis TaxID=1006155 RepID=A0A1S7FXH7_9LIST|nr:nuclear transport factor 2 family protein [Listeria weihenstephanensis]AQY52146.1 DNA-binding protein [Listeria weihenstephanensis]EUJ39431.1 DNA-binding domain-containing protein [Listeria weihenstephanensis FSL R9-0317]
MTKLPNIGKPATNALQLLDINTLEQVVEYDEKTLLKLHGVGPKAIRILKEALSENGLTFTGNPTKSASSGVGFAVFCDFDCDNAPKKRIIRDYLVASASGDRAALESVLEESFVWTVPGEFEIKGRDKFIAELVANLQAVSILEVQSLLSHGKEGSAHGTVTNKKGKHVYFSDIFTFQSNKPDAKISKLTSFVVIEN